MDEKIEASARGAEYVGDWPEEQIAAQIRVMRAAGFTVERDGDYVRVSGHGTVHMQMTRPVVSTRIRLGDD